MPKATEQTIRLQGTVYGPIWWPIGAICWRDVDLDAARDFRFSEDERPTARDFAIAATSSGDFQGSDLARDSAFIFERKHFETDSTGRIIGVRTRRRVVPVTAFRSIADCVGKLESWELEAGGEE